MIEKIKNFLKDEEGAAMVEYGLLVALIAVVLVASLQALEGGIAGVFGRAVTALAS